MGFIGSLFMNFFKVKVENGMIISEDGFWIVIFEG